MEFLNKLLGYLNPSGFVRRSDTEKKNVNLRFMHGINRISIWMMLIAVIIMIFRYFIL
jgi:hypothetical protein